MSGCPDENELLALLTSAASEALRERVLPHLQTCVACQQVLAAGAVATRELLPGTTLGRYVVESVLGSGAAGVVYAALDVELNRRVALKVMREGGADHDELQRRTTHEAQALARLSHRNVVTVFEMGTHRGSRFMAMELVSGGSLAQWLKTARPWREVVHVFREAATGLSAAHDAGLVHRDFKPANVVVGDDGQVRVTDFGLATQNVILSGAASGVEGSAVTERSRFDSGCASAQRDVYVVDGAIVGTPAFMAPEVLRGAPATALSDQYSFFISLQRALADHHVPRRIRRAIEQGLDAEPSRRHPSMHAVVSALAPPTFTRRTAFALGTAALTLAAVTVMAVPRVRCRLDVARLDTVWNPRVRDSVRAALGHTPYGPVVADKVLPTLDAYAAEWKSLRAEACLDSSGDGLVTACLDARLDHLSAVAVALAEAEPLTTANAIQATAALEPLRACADRTGFSAIAAPTASQRPRVEALRRDLSRAHVDWRLGHYANGLKRVAAMRDETLALGFNPLVAELEWQQGVLEQSSGKLAEAEATLRRAASTAEAARDVPLVARSWVQLVSVVGDGLARKNGFDEVTAHARAAVERVEGDARPLKLQLHLGLARAFIQFASLEAAATELEAAAPLVPMLYGERSLEMAELLHEQGRLAARRLKKQEAAEVFRRELALLDDLLGAEHPSLARVYQALANAEQWLNLKAEARAHRERAVALAESPGAADLLTLAAAVSSLGGVFEEERDYDKARHWRSRAVGLLEKSHGHDHPNTAITVMQLALLEHAAGDLTKAGALADDAVARLERSQGADSPRLATCLRDRAQIRFRAGQPAAAEADARRALDIMVKANGAKSATTASYLRIVARIATETGRGSEALALCQRALDVDSAVQGKEAGDTARDLTCLGWAQLELGRHAEAATSLRRARELRGPTPRDTWEAGWSTFLLARALWEAPKPNRKLARELLEEADAKMAAFGPSGEVEKRQLAQWRLQRGAK